MADKGHLSKAPVGGETYESSLEMKYIVEYLGRLGLTLKDTRSLDPQERLRVMREATRYASGKLAEAQSKARFVKELHDAGEGF